jgi:hypothetical protein
VGPCFKAKITQHGGGLGRPGLRTVESSELSLPHVFVDYGPQPGPMLPAVCPGVGPRIPSAIPFYGISRLGKAVPLEHCLSSAVICQNLLLNTLLVVKFVPSSSPADSNHSTMAVPVALATFAACGSIVTSIKSSWELRRMVKRKQESKECDEEAPYIFRRLRRAYNDGLMGTTEYEQWYEKFLVAKVEKDCEYSPNARHAVSLQADKSSQCRACEESART